MVTVCELFAGRNLQFVIDLAGAGNFCSFRSNGLLFFFRFHRAFESYRAVLRDDLDVVRSGGERFVFHDGATNLRVS